MTDDPDTFPADLVALVGSRLCHDLISPLSAISNGVELLGLSGAGMSPEIALIAESVAAANAKLKFFRVAFGSASAGQMVAAREINALLQELSSSGRLKLALALQADQPRHMVKLAYLAILCIETALPWGGQVTIDETATGWIVRAEADRTKPDPALWATLDGAEAELRPAQVQFALLPREAAAHGRQLGWGLSDGSVWIAF